ncbi:MAG: toprim domain-containing protein [Chloroflexi bacterium]|nr:toprim domain-containing protein [Chloroflexota bacterium]
MAIPSSQRFTRRHPCPICGGFSEAPRGRGVRCYGFVSGDGRYAHCTRPEYRGALRETGAATYAHRIEDGCTCGVIHGGNAPRLAPPRVVNDGERSAWAREIWSKTRAAAGTSVESYLRLRGLTCAIPPSLRYSVLRHPQGSYHGCMVAAVTVWPEPQPQAIHRTYLASGGKGKASVAEPKMSLGPIKGGAVRLGTVGETLLIAEGIETAMSGQQDTNIPAWATVCASNMPNLVLPPFPLAREIIIAADADDAGLSAAHKAADTWTKQGREVRIATPPVGLDLNDVLRGVA